MDYTGLTYEKLRERSGIPWPCNEQAPERHRPALHGRGLPHRHRLLRDATATTCSTGAAGHRAGHRAMAPAGRAFLKAAPYTPPHEEPDDEYPLLLHHRPDRVPLPHPDQDRPLRPLNDAAPDAWVELNPADAER